MNNIEIATFRGMDFSGYAFPLITVYLSPEDFPGKYVARLFDLDKPTPYCVWKWSLRQLEDCIPAQMVFMERQEEDHDSILGVYL